MKGFKPFDVIIVIVFVISASKYSSSYNHLSNNYIDNNNNNYYNDYNDNGNLMDFRFNNARIDGITNLLNGSLLIISNDYYWILDRQNPLPFPYNVKGHIKQLYDGFDHIDSIWIDPYNDVSPQIYLVSNDPKYGLRVVCKEFDDEPFNNQSSFCHLPVDHRWREALKDLDFNKPIDAVTWRNRTKNQDGGFWVFFQGNKMITIDPYEMKLRYTYDIQKWMSLNESLTAVFYDYRKSVYHLFFDNNQYRTWTVDVMYMNNLPMSWDRAFLHGKLSEPMLINRDFLGFPANDLKHYPQPNYRRKNIGLNVPNNNRIDGYDRQNNNQNYDDRYIDRRNRYRSTSTTTTPRPKSNPFANVHRKSFKTNNFKYENRNNHLKRLQQEDVRDFSPIKSNHIRQTDISSSSSAILSTNSLSSSSSAYAVSLVSLTLISSHCLILLLSLKFCTNF